MPLHPTFQKLLAPFTGQRVPYDSKRRDMDRSTWHLYTSENRRRVRQYRLDVEACAFADSPSAALRNLQAASLIPVPKPRITAADRLLRAQRNRRTSFVTAVTARKRELAALNEQRQREQNRGGKFGAYLLRVTEDRLAQVSHPIRPARLQEVA